MRRFAVGVAPTADGSPPHEMFEGNVACSTTVMSMAPVHHRLADRIVARAGAHLLAGAGDAQGAALAAAAGELTAVARSGY